MKKILIGLDDSKYAEHAVEYGFKLAHKLHAEVGLVHIVEPIVAAPVATVEGGLGMPFDTGTDLVTPELYQIQDERSRNMIAEANKKYGDNKIHITNFTEYGSTADGILKCAKDFDAELIVIGTHSRSGFDRFLMGSVTEDIVRQSEIPVLIVPMKGKKS